MRSNPKPPEFHPIKLPDASAAVPSSDPEPVSIPESPSFILHNRIAQACTWHVLKRIQLLLSDHVTDVSTDAGTRTTTTPLPPTTTIKPKQCTEPFSESRAPRGTSQQGIVTEESVLAEVTATYQPKTGGIHPREAAQHHATHIASVIRNAIKSAGDVEIDGIAFSQGPSMGPCLRTVVTAARAVALSLDVPLIGVNHCVAPRDRQVTVRNR